jgi:hypothetical protein
MVVQDKERFEAAADSFPELDEAARKRAAARVEQGSDPHAAFAAESVQIAITKAYN